MIRLARKHSETGSRTVAGTMLILNFVHLKGFKDRIPSQTSGLRLRFITTFATTKKSPDHAGLELSDGVRSGVLQGNLCCHGEFPSPESDRKSHFLVSEQYQLGELQELMLTLTHQPVSDGFRHEVILSDVLSEGDQPARLIQHVFPHQTRHPRHTLDPCHIRRDVGARVGRPEVNLTTGKCLLQAELRSR